MNVEFTPQNAPDKRSLPQSFTLVFRRQKARREMRWLTIGLVIAVIGGTIWQLWPAGEQPADPASDDQPAVAEETEASGVNVLEATPVELGQMMFRDYPEQLCETVRYSLTREDVGERGRTHRVALVYTRARDGLWEPHTVSLNETVPGTGLQLIRIDPLMALATDKEGIIHRLFNPADQKALDETYQFRRIYLTSSLVKRAQTEMWLKHTGSRRILGVQLVATHGGPLDDYSFAALVGPLEKFAVQYMETAEAGEEVLPAAEALRAWIAEHKLPCAVAPADSQMAVNDN